MLLSDKKVQALIKESFVPMWNMVRPAPQVTIDFGNGKKLKRTLKGNTAMYICRIDGSIADILPGVYTPDVFLPRVSQALVQLGSSSPALIRPAAGARRINSIKASLQSPLLVAPPRTATAVGKSAVESPIVSANPSKSAMQSGFGDGASRPAANGSKSGAQSTVLKAIGTTSEPIGSRIVDMSALPMSGIEIKAWAETQVGRKINTPEELAKVLVDLDAQQNDRYVRPEALRLLAQLKAGAKPADIRSRLYKEVLHVDIDDPYLGLADNPIPGTPGKGG